MISRFNLDSLPLDCLISIASQLIGVRLPSDKLILLTLSRLSLVSSAFSKIGLEFLKGRPELCNEIVIFKIKQETSIDQKINDLSFLMKNNLVINPKRMIMQCEVLYDLPEQLKQVLEGKVIEQSKKVIEQPKKFSEQSTKEDKVSEPPKKKMRLKD